MTESNCVPQPGQKLIVHVIRFALRGDTDNFIDCLATRDCQTLNSADQFAADMVARNDR